MKRALAAAVVVVACLSLTACGEESDSEREYRQDQNRRYQICVENGGSWIRDGWGSSCIMPGYEQ